MQQSRACYAGRPLLRPTQLRLLYTGVLQRDYLMIANRRSGGDERANYDDAENKFPA